MEISINIDDYVSDQEKHDLCVEYIREVLRGDGNRNHKERVLSNMAYYAAYQILDSQLTREDKKTIRTKIKKVIQDRGAYGIFRAKNAWGEEDSEAYLEVKKAVAQHKHLINDLVKKQITERDYTRDLEENSDYIGEVIIEAIKKGLS